MPKGVHLSRVTLNCAYCNQEFSKVASDKDRIFCSNDCKLTARAAKPAEQKTCLYCNSLFFKKSHKKEQFYCSASCAKTDYNKKKKEENLLNGYWHNYKQAKKFLLAESDSCQSCGWNKVPEILELHHKDCNNKNNHRSNLILLCPTCHTIEHYNSKTGQFSNNIGRKKK